MPSKIIYISAFIIILLAIGLIYYCTINAAPDTPPEDTIYFKVIDIDSNESYIHDSGYKPSTLPVNPAITLQILKTEYNDGKARKIGIPKTIILGRHPKNLNHRINIPNESIKDDPLYYKVLLSLKSFVNN